MTISGRFKWGKMDEYEEVKDNFMEERESRDNGIR